MQLKEDAISFARRNHIYAKAGSPVKIIADCGTALIVEDETGNRFPVSPALVTQDPLPENPAPVQSAPVETKKAPVKKKSAPATQNTLF